MRVFSFGLALVLAPFLVAQSPELVATDTSLNIFNMLQQHDPLVIVLETDFRQLKQDRADESWQPGLFQIKNGDSIVYAQSVLVASRGNMRKKTCYYPPIKIRFDEAAAPNDTLADAYELKVVINCGNTTQDQQLIARENLAYELYHLITPESFRTKSATIQFHTPGRKRADKQTRAFFIESEKEMAARLGGRPLKPRIISPKTLDSLAYTRMCVFQYMIGNTDFGSYSRHNMKIVGFPDRRPLPVPYDFDYAGLVDADYALPSADVSAKSVRERHYLGLCYSPELHQLVFAEFRANKEKILAHCEQYPGLSPTSRQDVRHYLRDFFSVLENPDRARKEIIEHCNYRVKKD